MMKKLVYFILLVVTIIGLNACSDSLLNESPPDLLGPDVLYTDAISFETGINGLYSLVVEEHAGTAIGSQANDLRKDAMALGTDNMYGNYETGFITVANQWEERNNPDEGMYLDLWTWLYEIINAANTIVDRSDNPDIDWTEDEKNRIVAEALCFRAWAYRHLTYLFGDVPLTLNESTGANLNFAWERDLVSEIREQMEEDWLFAKEHLPEIPSKPGKLVRGVAQHYLAELYLAQGRDEEARDEVLNLIDNGPFSLVTDRYGVQADEPGTPFTDMFIYGNSNFEDGNTEVLWTFQAEYQEIGGEHDIIMRRWHVNRYYSHPGISVTVERGGRGIGRVAPTDWALNLYEEDDDRGSSFAWQYYFIYDDEVDDIPDDRAEGDTVHVYAEVPEVEPINSIYWPHTRKWNGAEGESVTIARQYNDHIYLRLAETYLILAEAQYKIGNTGITKPGAAWAINQLRDRANASLVTGADIDIDFILDERSRELYSEEHRRYTLLRTGKWLERTGAHNTVAGSVITERDTIFPIPQDVIDDNTQGPFPQNPGY